MLDAGPVEGVAGGKVVGAVEHDVGLRHKGFDLRGADALVQPDDVHFRIDRKQGGARRGRLPGADRIAAVQDLPLKVGEVDLVGIRQGQAAYARRGKVERRGRAQAAGADDQRV
jgi:hypothetical protein